MKKSIGTCGRCNGEGKVRWAAHYANGVCFQCSGRGVIIAEVTHEVEDRFFDSLAVAVAHAVEAREQNDGRAYRIVDLATGKQVTRRQVREAGLGRYL